MNAVQGPLECYHCTESSHFVHNCPKKSSGCPPSHDGRDGRRSQERPTRGSHSRQGRDFHCRASQGQGCSGSRGRKTFQKIQKKPFKWGQQEQEHSRPSCHTYATQQVLKDKHGNLFVIDDVMEEIQDPAQQERLNQLQTEQMPLFFY